MACFSPSAAITGNPFQEGVSHQSHPSGLNRRPAVYETVRKPLLSPGETRGRDQRVTNEGAEEGPVEGLRGVALELLTAVDDGRPAGGIARGFAVEVLRSMAPDSAPWRKAVEVLEGGPFRMRRAVDLAGLVLDATAGELAADGHQGATG